MMMVNDDIVISNEYTVFRVQTVHLLYLLRLNKVSKGNLDRCLRLM